MQERTTALHDWLGEQKCRRLVHNLTRRHFTATYCPDAAAAANYIMTHAAAATTIGFGGSLSVADLKLTKPLAALGKEILNHGFPDLTPEQRADIRLRQHTCDLFLSGTNAVTLDGILVNIDGVGNRVAAMIHGPKKVIIVAGRNKIIEGTVDDAIRRIKDRAAPLNARRLGHETPCAATGFCADCDSPQRICRATTIIDRKPITTDLHVLAVNEDMGL